MKAASSILEHEIIGTCTKNVLSFSREKGREIYMSLEGAEI